MGFTLVMPFLPLYFQQLGVEDLGEVALWTGISLGVTPAMTAVLAPLWGRLADRFGFRLMVGRSLLSFIFLMGALSVVTQPWHVFALRALQGLFAGYGALTLTMAARSAPPERIAWSIGVVQTAQRLGPAIGPVVGGIIAPLVGLRAAFLVSAVFFGLAFVAVMLLYRQPPAPAGRRAAGADARVTFRSVVAFQNFLLLMGVVLGLQFVDRTLGPILPLFVAVLGTPGDQVALVAGLLFSGAAGMAALGNSLAGRLLTRRRARTIIGACTIAGAGALCVLGTARSVAWVGMATPVFGLSIGIAITTAYAAAARVLPTDAQSVGFGFLTSASLVGLALSPVVSGALAAASIRAVFALDVVIMVALAVVVMRLMVDDPRAAGES